jgi:hypothetical protein
MLLTKRLSTFLSQNTTPQLHTLILLSPTGKVLCSSSPFPSSTLRTQATLAVSLWSLYHPFHPTTATLVTDSLSSSISDVVPTSGEEGHDLSAITIQLEYGIMSIRTLISGLLFVAIGPSPPSQFTSSQHVQPRIASSTNTSAPGSPGIHEIYRYESQVSLHVHGEVLSGAVSDAGSAGSERGAQASIFGVRRRADEVGAALEGRLEGFVLSPEGR